MSIFALDGDVMAPDNYGASCWVCPLIHRLLCCSTWELFSFGIATLVSLHSVNARFGDEHVLPDLPTLDPRFLYRVNLLGRHVTSLSQSHDVPVLEQFSLEFLSFYGPQQQMLLLFVTVKTN